MADRLCLTQLNLAVHDMNATAEFYRRLGAVVDVAPDAQHASASLGDGLTLELDTVAFVRSWNVGWDRPAAGGAVIGFTLASREAVDRAYADLVEVGHRAQQPPYDAFWGARYAVVEDPDGRPVGLMSPIDAARKFWPPSDPPPPPEREE